MTAGQARIELASISDAVDIPELRAEELDWCLRRARRPDPAGCTPDMAEYVGTYDMNYAALLAWRLKAGKCANFHGVTTQGRNFNAGEVHAHCMAMIAEYRRSLNGTVTVYSDAYYPY